jgi:hypothetical protein
MAPVAVDCVGERGAGKPERDKTHSSQQENSTVHDQAQNAVEFFGYAHPARL